MPPPYPLILASASPRRRELLASVGLEFEVAHPNLDETRNAGESPQAFAKRVASDKAKLIAAQHPGTAVLAADTIVVLQGRVFGKPKNAKNAAEMLTDLSGKTHAVLTAVAVVSPAGRYQTIVRTTVRFRRLSPEFVSWYSHSEEPKDKAGAYAIQGAAGSQIESIQGSPSNVVGLPLSETLALLAAAGVQLPWGPR